MFNSSCCYDQTNYLGGIALNLRMHPSVLSNDEGLEKLRARGYTAIPVLDRSGFYVGTVSEGDFLWHILDWKDNSLRSKEKLPLRQVLRPDFNPAVRVDITPAELLERAMRQSFIPVVDDRGAFVGIVTRQTIIRRLTVPRAEEGGE